MLINCLNRYLPDPYVCKYILKNTQCNFNINGLRLNKQISDIWFVKGILAHQGQIIGDDEYYLWPKTIELLECLCWKLQLSVLCWQSQNQGIPLICTNSEFSLNYSQSDHADCLEQMNLTWLIDYMVHISSGGVDELKVSGGSGAVHVTLMWNTVDFIESTYLLTWCHITTVHHTHVSLLLLKSKLYPP